MPMKTERTSTIEASNDAEIIRYMYPRLVEKGILENHRLVEELMTMRKLAEWEADLD